MNQDNKNLVWYCNMVFYILYKIDVKAGMLFNKINPFYQITRYQQVREFYKKKGVTDIRKSLDNSLINLKYGLGIMRAGIALNLPFVMIECGFFNYAEILLGIPLIKYVFNVPAFTIIFVLVFIAPLSIFFHFTIYKNKKYLTYFKQFEKNNEHTKLQNYLFVAGVFLFALLFVVLSFYIMSLSKSIYP